jgi:hypothetical protein
MRNRLSRRAVALAAAAPFAVVIGLGVASPAFATSPVDGSHKVTFCHATGSKTNPYVIITTDKIAVVQAHSKHQNDEDMWPMFTYDDHGTPVNLDGSLYTGPVDASMCGGQIG